MNRYALTGGKLSVSRSASLGCYAPERFSRCHSSGQRLRLSGFKPCISSSRASVARTLSIVSPSLPATWNRSSAYGTFPARLRIARRCVFHKSGQTSSVCFALFADPLEESLRQLDLALSTDPRQLPTIRTNLARQGRAAVADVVARARVRARKAANRDVDSPGTQGRGAMRDLAHASPGWLEADDS